MVQLQDLIDVARALVKRIRDADDLHAVFTIKDCDELNAVADRIFPSDWRENPSPYSNV